MLFKKSYFFLDDHYINVAFFLQFFKDIDFNRTPRSSKNLKVQILIFRKCYEYRATNTNIFTEVINIRQKIYQPLLPPKN